MAKCPNCGAGLKLTDWRPECPSCGVNLNYYRSNERLLEESETAEAEHALFQPKVDRGKAAYFSSPKTILRIVFTLLPAGALFLPLAKAGKNLNAIDLYKLIDEKGAGILFSSGAFGIWVLLLALSAVMMLVNLIFLIASLGKHGKVRTTALYGAMLGLTIASLFFFFAFAGSPGSAFPGVTAASPGVGLWLYAALQAWSCGWCYSLLKTGIPVNCTKTYVGGLPSEKYFDMVKQGLSTADIRRKMLIALAEQTDAAAGEEAGV